MNVNEIDISEEDIYEALREIPGYLDVTPEDFAEVYRHAYRHALKKIERKREEGGIAERIQVPTVRCVELLRRGFDTKPIRLAGALLFDRAYIKKMKGHTKSPPSVGTAEVIWSWIGSFLGIALVAFINYRLLDATALIMMIGSFGASAVLLYGAVKSPLAQPRNLIGGHMLSALVGVAAYKVFSPNLWLASAMAVSCAIAVMHVTKTLHPPGGATALIAVMGGEAIYALGFSYAFMPVGAGAFMMLIVALLVNNIPRSRKYPEFWM